MNYFCLAKIIAALPRQLLLKKRLYTLPCVVLVQSFNISFTSVNDTAPANETWKILASVSCIYNAIIILSVNFSCSTYLYLYLYLPTYLLLPTYLPKPTLPHLLTSPPTIPTHPSHTPFPSCLPPTNALFKLN